MEAYPKTCCFSGHRPKKLPWGKDENAADCLAVKQLIYDKIEQLYNDGYRVFICGMAEGCDLYFAEAVLKLQTLHDDVELRAAVPCPEQADSWSALQKSRYEEILSQCSEVIILQPSYTRGCMQRRNKYMVDRSSALLACYNGLPGGTMNTIVYADREGLEVYLIDISGLTGGEENEL